MVRVFKILKKQKIEKSLIRTLIYKVDATVAVVVITMEVATKTTEVAMETTEVMEAEMVVVEEET